MEIINRQEALASDLPRYFTGKPCKHGHVAQRYTKCKMCVDCPALYRRQRREKDPEGQRLYMCEQMRKWRAENLDHYREYQREYHRTYRPGYRRKKKAESQ